MFPIDLRQASGDYPYPEAQTLIEDIAKMHKASARPEPADVARFQDAMPLERGAVLHLDRQSTCVARGPM